MPPFWIDKPSQHDARRVRPERVLSFLVGTMAVFLTIVTMAVPALLFASLAKPLLYAWVAFCVFVSARALWLIRRLKVREREVSAVQEATYRASGSRMMGSANHVAGHPALGRDQRVLLAVDDNALRLFDFANPEPVDHIVSTAIQKVELVVYDDERVPHTDAIDPAAQALQVTFSRGTVTARCLFNRMLNHRPIDWYHELEKLRCSPCD